MFYDHKVVNFMRNYGIYETKLDELYEIYRVLTKVSNYTYGMATHTYDKDIEERLKGFNIKVELRVVQRDLEGFPTKKDWFLVDCFFKPGAKHRLPPSKPLTRRRAQLQQP